MRALILSISFVALLAGAAAPAQSETYAQARAREAAAHRYAVRHPIHRTSCRHDKRTAGNQGTALGAVSGGLIGAELGHGLTGGLIGAGVGAVAGHQIAKGTVHC